MLTFDLTNQHLWLTAVKVWNVLQDRPRHCHGGIHRGLISKDHRGNGVKSRGRIWPTSQSFDHQRVLNMCAHMFAHDGHMLGNIVIVIESRIVRCGVKHLQ